MPASIRAGRPSNTDATALPRTGGHPITIVVADDTNIVEHLGNAGRPHAAAHRAIAKPDTDRLNATHWTRALLTQVTPGMRRGGCSVLRDVCRPLRLRQSRLIDLCGDDGSEPMKLETRRNPRWAAVAGVALACCLLATACGSGASGGGPAATAKPANESYFGPPPGATQIAAIGSADQVANLTFVTHGRRYLVHIGPVPVVRTSSDPTRSATYRQRDGTKVAATCAGSSESSAQPGVVQVAGPLSVSWTEARAVVSALSQDETGPCSPTEADTRLLVEFVQSLPRLDSDAWAHLVAVHPLDATSKP